MLSKYNNKFIYGCKFLQTRLNLNPKTFSLCHEAQVGDQILGTISELSVKQYEKALSKLIEKNFDKNSPCRRCDKCEKYLFQEKQIRYVTINTSNYCNSKCIYCQSHFGEEDEFYNPIPFLENFENYRKFYKHCWFDWGGGEPTLNPFFEDCVNWIEKQGYFQRINTNAIEYSKATEAALKEGNASLRVSIDAGTKECFHRMKGHEHYETVWDNIKQYRKVSDKIYIKYNICNYNSDKQEIDVFLDNCKKNNLNNVLIDAEVSAYQPEKNSGPFYFTKKEFDVAHYMKTEAQKMGLFVEVSSYAYSVRGEYDKDGRLKLPSKYFDNIDRKIISNNIYAQTFPSIEYMAGVIKRQESEKIIVWGAGKVGKKVIQILRSYGIEITQIIDSNSNLAGTLVEDIPIMSPDKVLTEKSKCIIILAGQKGKEMLRIINEINFRDATVYWMLHE